MKSAFAVCAALVLFAVSDSLWALGEASIGKSPELPEGLSIAAADYADAGWLNDDRNGDGRIDYAVLLDDKLNRVYEVLDTNNDGLIDDIYVYRNDVLVRRELDRDYNGRIDLWLYISQGVYVLGWDLDTDGDGIIDDYKEFGS